MNINLAKIWNYGNQFFNVKGENQFEINREIESTDGENWGGLICSSEESSVMEVERRN